MPEILANIPSAAERQATEMQRRIWAKLAKLVTLSNAWVVSRPNERTMRFECRADNNDLAAKLSDLHFYPVFLGTKDRVSADGLFRVNVYEIRINH